MDSPEPSPLARLHAGLLEVAAILHRSEDLQQVLDAIARTTATSLGWGTVAINLFRPAWSDLEVISVYGSEEARAALLGRTTEWESWEPLIAPPFDRRGASVIPHGAFDWDAQDAAIYTPAFTPVEGEDAWHPEDALFVVMRDLDGSVLGVISFDEPEHGRHPSDLELDALVAVAGHAGLTIRLATDVAQARRHREALEHILEVFSRSRDLSSAEELLAEMTAGIRETLGFERVEIELLKAGAEAPLARVLAPRFERHGCYLMTAAEARELAPEVDFGPPSARSGRGPLAWRDHRLFAPLQDSSGRLLGMICVEDPADRLLPSLVSLHALRVFADQAAMAIEAAGRLRELRYLADHDPLTGLRNRRAFMTSLYSETARANRYGSRFTLALCDVDDLKARNDELGHPAGDRALVRVSRVLEQSLRRSDGAYRIGGDEFALILIEGDTEGHAERVTERIRATLAGSGEGGDPPIGVSFGAATCRGGDNEDPESLLRRADEAMYVAKRAK
jgi:diguanylate cyclase (GGDEF)-like protein